MTRVYSIYDLSPETNKKLGSCVTDGYSREEVIDAAQGYYEERDEEEGNSGNHSRDMILVIYDDKTGEEKIEEITISWTAERGDGYDGGRFDYLAGIGAIRSF